MTTIPIRRSPLRLVGMLAAAALLAACGGGGDGDTADVASLSTAATAGEASTDDTTENSATGDPEEAMLAYSECMREHGVEMPDPVPANASGDGGGAIALDVDPSGEEFEEAHAECQPILDDAFGSIEQDPQAEAEMREQMLAYAECMRENGIDMPDPQFADGGRTVIEAEGLEPGVIDGDAFEAANEQCGIGGGHGGLVTSRDAIASSGS